MPEVEIAGPFVEHRAGARCSCSARAKSSWPSALWAALTHCWIPTALSCAFAGPVERMKPRGTNVNICHFMSCVPLATTDSKIIRSQPPKRAVGLTSIRRTVLRAYGNGLLKALARVCVNILVQSSERCPAWQTRNSLPPKILSTTGSEIHPVRAGDLRL